jgi:hypothetical protein
MAFIWEGSSKGDIISYNDIREVRDNVDEVDDNPACISHNVTYHDGHFITEYGTHYTGNDLTQRTSNLASPYYLGNDTSHRIGHRTTYNASVWAANYVTANCVTYYLSQDTTPHNSSNRASPHYTSVRSPHNSVVQTTHNWSHK